MYEDFDQKNSSEQKAENFYNSLNRSGYLKSPVYYSESAGKSRKKKGFSILQLVIVSLLSSMVGAGAMFFAFQFLIPAINSNFNGYFDRLAGQSVPVRSTEPAVSYKIEIEKTDSPVTWIAKKVSPSIVGVRVTAQVQNFLFGLRENTGEGSGIIVKEDGHIVTNYHVIQNAYDSNTNKVSKNASIEIIIAGMEDKPYKAEIVGVDWKTDLAVLKINGNGFTPVEMGDSENLEVGEMVIAIGNPGGLEYMGSVTMGIVSGLNRTVQAENGYEFKLIQTDAAINPGNSGGALVNSRGQLIGINSIKIVASGFEGIGFAIPISTAKEIFENLIEHKYVPGRPLLGLRIDDAFNADAARMFRVPEGVLVKEVIPFSGAYKTGIQSGDIVVKCQGEKVTTLEELNEIKDRYKPGEVVELEVYREGKYLTFEIELGEDKPFFTD